MFGAGWAHVKPEDGVQSQRAGLEQVRRQQAWWPG